MADEQDVPTFLDQSLRLAVDLRAPGGRSYIDIASEPLDLALLPARTWARRAPKISPVDRRELRRVHRRKSPGKPAQPVDDEAVMYDFMAHIDRRAEALQRELDNLDRAVDTCAEAARRCDQHAKVSALAGELIHPRCRPC